MINAIILFVILILVFIFVLKSMNGRFSELNITQAKIMDKNNYFDNIVDVRSKIEFEKSRHPKAINIPLDNLENELPKEIPNRNNKVLFYCKEGIRASGALDIAKNLGYNKIYYLDDLSSQFF